MVGVKAPGKLMLAGEWSVLEKGNPCIVLAVNKYVTASIEAHDSILINARDIGLENVEAEFNWKVLKIKSNLTGEQKEKIIMAQNAVETALCYLSNIGIKTKTFSVSTASEISVATLKDGSTTKVGFGSSAAAVVSIIAAILKFHNLEIESAAAKERIYKLACIAHYFGQGKVGSAFDVAASTYGGALVYRRFDPDWLVAEIELGEKISEIVQKKWPAFEATAIRLPGGLSLCVGFVGYSASTKELVTKMDAFKQANPKRYNEIYNKINKVVEHLIAALEANDKEQILSLIKENRLLLKQLSDESGNNLETRELTKLIEAADEAGAAAKFSGAGGGDCGIAVCFNAATAQKVKNRWQQQNIYPVDVAISEKGVE